MLIECNPVVIVVSYHHDFIVAVVAMSFNVVKSIIVVVEDALLSLQICSVSCPGTVGEI